MDAAWVPRRRNRTRQRERLLALLRESREHPTAAALHARLRHEFPAISLGTVYRNLEILRSQGLIDVLPSAPEATRFDGNPRPHHHFRCELCGALEDLEQPLPANVQERLHEYASGRVDRIRIEFAGTCSACLARQSPSHPNTRAQRRTSTHG